MRPASVAISKNPFPYSPIPPHIYSPPPAHPRAIIYHPPRFGSSYFLKYWNSGFLQIGHQSHHLVRHPRLQRTPLEAHRTGSMFCPSFIINYGTRVTLWSIMFRNVTFPGKTHTPYFCLKYRNSIFLQVHHGCLRICGYASWQNFENMVSPANLTITARTASKFCARARSQSRNNFDLSLIS